jgi:hypothetical protein
MSRLPGWVVVFVIAVGRGSPAGAGTDALPWSALSLLPMIGQDGGLGGRWTSVAFAASTLGTTANPAALLSRPGARTEIRYRVGYAVPRAGERLDRDTTQGLEAWAVAFSGMGSGLALFYHRPLDDGTVRVRPEEPRPVGRLWAEQTDERVRWSEWGLSLAIRLQEDFVVGFGVARSTLSATGETRMAAAVPTDARQWRLRQDARDRAWHWTLGAQWAVYPHVVFGIAYHWLPTFDMPVEVETTRLDGSAQTETNVLRMAFPHALALGLHVVQGRWTVAVEGWRWKTGRLNEGPDLYLQLGPSERLAYEAHWDWRLSVAYDALGRKPRVIPHVGLWYRPALRPAWTGPEDAPLRDLFTSVWPPDRARWHGTAGLTLRWDALDLSAAYVHGPYVRDLRIAASFTAVWH